MYRKVVSDATDAQVQGTARYDAFISYSHAADGKLAPAVQAGLQRLARPFLKPRALRVFRDRTSLSASPHLWGSIETALLDSRFFVLLASPDAAASPWVNQEVSAWKAARPVASILIALTDGDSVWDREAGDFDVSRSSAIPTALRGLFDDEPLHVDLRWAYAETDLSLRHSRFREAIADLAAPIHGIPKEDLEGVDVRQHRKTRRFVGSAIAALVALTIAALGLGLLAILERNRAIEQRQVAERQSRFALSRQLAAQALSNIDDRLDLAILLGLQGYDVQPTFEARNSVVAALQRSEFMVRYLRDGGDRVAGVAFSPDGTTLVSASGSDGMLVLWDVGTGERLGEQMRHGESVLSVAFSPDGRTLASGGFDGTVVLWNLATGRPLGEPLEGSLGSVSSVAFSPGGSTLASGGSTVILWDVATGERVGQPMEGAGQSVAYSPDGKILASGGSFDGTVTLWDAATGEPLGALEHGDGQQSVAFSPDGKILASAGSDGTVVLWDVATAERLEETMNHGQPVSSIAFSPDGKTLASGGFDGTVILWDVSTGEPLRQPFEHGDSVLSVAFSPDGKTLASGGSEGGFDGTMILWDLTTVGPLKHRDRVVSIAFSPDGKTLASGGFDGTVILWDVAMGEPLGEPLEQGDWEVLSVASAPTERPSPPEGSTAP